MAEIVKCGTCKRPYNAALETCPFCARQQAGYREVIAERAPQHEAFKAARAEIEEGEARVRAL
ncbi:MAG: hypothetical protein K1X94_31365, partial [Sandaracinaceae bacterium]|nr:hypothetical protein [Sandaracinaceae bacterium]